MPASHERVPNRSLSGLELKQIIERDVAAILQKDGMLSNNIAFPRVAYEVRISIHMENPLYPEHVIEVLSRRQANDKVATNSGLAAIENAPLAEVDEENAAIISEERSRVISSPNMSRVEHGLPLKVLKRNLDTGVSEEVDQKFVGDAPDPESVGNTHKDMNTADKQRHKWNKHK